MISKESKGSWPGFWAPAGDGWNSWKQKAQGEEQVGVQGRERKHSHTTVTWHWHVEPQKGMCSMEELGKI